MSGKKELIRLAAACVLAACAGCTPHDDPVVLEVIAHARADALNSERVDWPKVEAAALGIARKTGGEQGRAQGIGRVLYSLQDGHSHYISPDAVPRGATAPRDDADAPRPIAVSEPPRDGFGWLTIGAWRGDDAAMRTAAAQVRDALNEAMRHDACGLVLDVAHNGGGNMWPMMAGIAPLYDAGTLLSFETREGQRVEVRVADGKLYHAHSEAPPQQDALAPVLRKPRYIALLLGARTASSGEILAMGFRGQPNVRSFGARTRGATTANRAYRLSNGGILALTTSRLLDREGMVQQGPLVPDHEAWPAYDAALGWLRERCRS